MKRFTALFLMLLLLAALTGCVGFQEQDTYRMDTVIYIPAEPTEPETETTIEITEAEESEAAGETVPETTKTASSKKSSSFSSSGKKTSSASSSSKKPSSGTESTGAPTTAPTTAPTEAATTPAEEPTTEATTEATTVPVETESQLYDISGYVVGSLETAMMDEINSHRGTEGLSGLSKSSRLCAIASARAYEVCQSWSHTRPDGRGYATVFGDYGYGCGTSAENLIYTSGGEDAATLVSKWMNSDGNRNNLMNAGFTTVGIGVYKANGYVYIACLLTG